MGTPRGSIDLAEMAGQDAEAQVMAKLAELKELVDDFEVKEAEKELDPDDEAALRALCEADGAPLGWRSLGDRVRRGRLTWAQVWQQPYDAGRESVDLVRAVTTQGMREAMAEMDETLAGFRDFEDRGASHLPRNGPGSR